MRSPMLYEKTTTSENSDKKEQKLHFSGMRDKLKFKLEISGPQELVQDTQRELGLYEYNQMVEVEVLNKQKTLDEFEGA